MLLSSRRMLALVSKIDSDLVDPSLSLRSPHSRYESLHAHSLVLVNVWKKDDLLF